MATSGTKTQAFCSRNGSNRYYLQVQWSRTSYSESGNYSVISVNLYLGSYGNGYGMNASATKTGSISINGTSYSISKAGLSLSSGGKIKIWGKTGIQINHNTDGTKSFAISASFNPAVSISGSSCGTATISSTSFTLDTIPQASTLGCNANWTAGSNKTISISRKSTAFTHTVVLKVGSTTVATRTGVGASTTVAFTDAENLLVFQALNRAASASTTITVTTFKGSSQIGSAKSYSGTCTNVAASTTTYPASAIIGTTFSGKITEKHSKFTHRIRLLRSDKSTSIGTLQDYNSTTLNWSFTLPTSILALTPNSNDYTCYIELITYWNGTTTWIRDPIYYKITAKVTGSNPTFAPAGNLTYLDYNTTTTGITGNNQYLIQGYSKLRVTLAAAGLATARNSATMSKYQVTFAGTTKTVNHTAGTACTFDFGTISASTNQSLTITAIDSRGNKTTASKTVYVLPYQKPKVIVNATRKDGFTVTVPVSVKGSYSRLTVAGSDKNTISTVTHSMKVDSGTRPSQTKFGTITASGGNYNTNEYNYTLALTSIGSVRIGVQDKLGTVTVDVDISTGLPLFYLDSGTGSVSFNKLPSHSATLEMGLKFDLAPNQYWGNTNNTYGMHANNSDIVGVNSIVFHDSSNNLGEGLRYPNSTFSNPNSDDHTAPSGYGDYTNIYWRDNWCYINNVKSFGLTSGSGQSAKYQVDCDTFTLNHLADVNGTFSNKTAFRIVEGTTIELAMDANEAFCFKDSGASYGGFSWNLQAINFYVWNTDGSSAVNTRINTDSSGMFFQSPPVYTRSGTGGSAVVVSSAGTLYRSTSTAKAKLDIVPAYDSLEDYKKVLDIEPVKWFDKYACEANAAFMTAEVDGTECDLADRPNLNRVYGCVAEQLEEIGLDGLIYYDDENKEIASVAYDRIPIMYIPLFKDLYNQVEELKAEIQTLKGETGK